jgi:hypothetical protein
MTAPNSGQEKGPSYRAYFRADTNQLSANSPTEKAISTIRARLCQAGGQVLHVANGGVFFVTTPFGQIKRFDSFESLQASVHRIAK